VDLTKLTGLHLLTERNSKRGDFAGGLSGQAW